MSVSLNPRKILQLEGLQEDLRVQFRHMQQDWDNLKADIDDEIVFNEVVERAIRKLKKKILEALSLSCNEKADKLLDLNSFGDKIPSQGLKAMLKLVPAGEAENPGFLFRRIFLW